MTSDKSRGGPGPGAMPPNSSDRLKKICESAGVVTQYFDAGNDYICCVFTNSEDNVPCHVLQELQRLWLKFQAYWRSGPGRMTAYKQAHRRAGECTKIRTSRLQKLIKKILGRGIPYQSYQRAHILSAPLSALDLPPPKSKSCVRFWSRLRHNQALSILGGGGKDCGGSCPQVP